MTDQDLRNAFPVSECPSPDNPLSRMLGIYAQRQPGLLMHRVRVPGGLLTGEQWWALAAAAREITPDAPLRLTTRQELEFHNVQPPDVPQMEQRLAAVGLGSLGAGGDAARNVTVCPCSGTLGPDLQPLGRQVLALLQEQEDYFRLPRKFKVSFSACEDGCGQPFINDLGLVLRRGEGKLGFAVAIAGSLGARPCPGITYAEWVEPAAVLPLVLGALRVFAAYGDRHNRTQARLRHVRQRMGNETFVALVQQEVQRATAERAWPQIVIEPPTVPMTARRVLSFANGEIAPEAADALAQLADRPEMAVRIGNQHRVFVFGRGEAALHGAVAHPALAPAAEESVCVVACPGKKWCKRAVVDTYAAADRVRAALRGVLPPGGVVAVSGCPNGCAHGAVADVGLTGCLASPGVEGFDVWAGGDMGRTAALGQVVAKRVPAEQVVAEVARLAAIPGTSRTLY